MPSSHVTIKGQQHQPILPSDICYFAEANFRNQMRKFGILTDDRRRHMYVIGKTGMGKTTIMENMVLHDIYSGHGVGLVDPHGDFAEKIVDYIPPHRINDVVYINPSDTEYPIGFNILEVYNEEQKHLVASGLMGTFKKIWPDVWSARMEYILNNTLLALLDTPNTTLLGINRLLSDKGYRTMVVRGLKDPVVKAFWEIEFAGYEPRYQKEAVAPIQNKIGQFLSASVIRNMVAQVKSTINIRELMDTKKIVIMNLSKGRIGEDNSRLLGGMLITKIQLAAMERVDTPEEKRNDFFLYVDEFQNFATPSFANILSEARKYRLSLIMAHQYIAQLDEVVADAVFGNVGTIVCFRVGGADAEVLAKEFSPQFTEEDIVNLPKFQIFLKLMINGVASHPFSAQTMPPIAKRTDSSDRVIGVSRERYGRSRETIERKIAQWSGMDAQTIQREDEAETETQEGGVVGKPESKKDPVPNGTKSVPPSLDSSAAPEKQKKQSNTSTPKTTPPSEKPRALETKKERTPAPRPSISPDTNVSSPLVASVPSRVSPLPPVPVREENTSVRFASLLSPEELDRVRQMKMGVSPTPGAAPDPVVRVLEPVVSPSVVQEPPSSSEGSLDQPKKKRKRKRKKSVSSSAQTPPSGGPAVQSTAPKVLRQDEPVSFDS